MCEQALDALEQLRALQLLLGRSKLDSTVGYLGIEVDDSLYISEKTETDHEWRTPQKFVIGSSARISQSTARGGTTGMGRPAAVRALFGAMTGVPRRNDSAP